MSGFSLNAIAGQLADRVVAEAAQLRVGVTLGARGETIIDCGGNYPGGIEAGLRMACICMGGLGAISLIPLESLPRWPWHLSVRCSQPRRITSRRLRRCGRSWQAERPHPSRR